MNRVILNRKLSREVDQKAIREYGMSGLVLMENAGRSVAERVMALGLRDTICIVCGKGNNGGDGFVVARHLDNAGLSVHVLLLTEPELLSSDASVNFAILKNSGIPICTMGEKFDAAVVDRNLPATISCVVDAVLGTGSRGEPRPPSDQAITWMNDLSAFKLAIDIPSGLDCDSGVAAASTFVADRTCTLVAPKPGFYENDGPSMVGEVDVVDIGVPRQLLVELLSR